MKAASYADEVIETGARSGKYTDDMHRWFEYAPQAYDAIRNRTDDVTSIAHNTGRPQYQIDRVKQHLFYNEHILKGGEVGKFHPDPDIADAWNRLINGNFDETDLKLLDHEYFEAKYEGIFSTNYETAHDATIQSGRDWQGPLPGQ